MLTHKSLVMPWQCDQMGHMNTRFYMSRFDEAGAALFTAISGPIDVHKAEGFGWADVGYKVDFLGEAHDGDILEVVSTITKVGRSSIAFLHLMRRNDVEQPVASLAGTTVYFNLNKRAAEPLTDMLRTQFEGYLAAENVDAR